MFREELVVGTVESLTSSETSAASSRTSTQTCLP